MGSERTSVTHLPLPPEEFELRKQAQLQDLVLYDPEQQAEIMRHQRAMQRDGYRSFLRCEEYTKRQKSKQISFQIMEANGGIILEKIDGNNKLLKKIWVFSCRLAGLNRFHRKGLNIHFWQVEIAVGDKRLFSELYSEEVLQSICKLQRTVLGQYECSITTSERPVVWRWISQKLSQLYEQAPIIELPYLAGWFPTNERWLFWTRGESTVLVESEIISRFKKKNFLELDGKILVKELLMEKTLFASAADYGIFFNFRFSAFLSRLVEEELPSMGLTLIGEEALEIVKAYFRTMEGVEGDFDIINLDSDRLSIIRKRLFELQDTPIIFVSFCSENRSTRNRLSEIKSWLESGYIEGRRVMVPFIFCFQQSSPEYDLDGNIVVLTEEVQSLKGAIVFDQIQSFLTEAIENGGIYWINELRKCYKKRKYEAPDEADLLILGRTVIDIVLKILDPDEEEEKRLQEIFEQGFREMKQQLFLKTGILPEIFKDRVEDLCDRGEISVWDKKSGKIKGNDQMIYFDENYYYFSQESLRHIRKKIGFNQRAMLEVKRGLVAKDVVKQYRTTGQRQSEYEVDIFIGKHEKKRVSVLAVHRSFWDEPGKIALWERGEC